MKSNTVAESPKKRGFLDVALVILLCGIAVALVQYKVPSMLTHIMEYYNIGMTLASWLMSIFTFVGIVFSIPVGKVAAKTSSRFVLVSGLALAIIGSLMGAFVINGVVLLVSRGIEGIGLVFVTVAAPLAIDDYVNVEHRGAATGLWGTYSIGGVIAETVSPLIYRTAGIVGVWLVMAFICALATVAVFGILRHSRLVTGTIGSEAHVREEYRPEDKPAPAATEQPAPVPEEFSTPSIKEVLRKNVVLHMMGMVCFDVVILCMVSYVPLHLQQQGMDAALSGFLATLPMLLTLISSPMYGTLVDKLGKAKMLYLIASIVSGPCVFIMLTQSGLIVWVVAVLFGIVSSGMLTIFLASFPTVLGSPRLVSVGMGVAIFAMSIGQFLGTFLPPLVLGVEVTNWVLCGLLVLVFCVVGTVCIALAKFK